MKEALDKALQLLASRSGAAAVLAIVLLVVLASQVRTPEYSGSITEQITAQSAQLTAAAEINAARGDEHTLIVLVPAAETSIDTLFETLAGLEAHLTTSRIDAEVKSLLTLRNQLFLFGLEESDPASALLGALREGGRERALISRDASRYGLTVTVADAVAADTLNVLREYDFGADGVEVLAEIGLEQDVAGGLREELRYLIPGIVILMLATLLLAYRHWRALVLPIFASIASSIAVLSVLALTNTSINLVTMLALPIVLIVALANSCHFLAKARGRTEATTAAVTEVLNRVGVPYLASCLTTAVALASLVFNDIDPIQDLGVVASISLVVSFVLILLFAPWALLRHLKGRQYERSSLYTVFSGLLFRGRRLVAGLLLITAAVGAIALPSINMKSDPRIFFPDNVDFTRAFYLFEEEFYVFAPLRILVRSEDLNVEALQAASALRVEIDDADGVIQTSMEAAVDGSGFLITALMQNEPAAEVLVEILRGKDEHDLILSSAQLVYESVDEMSMSSLGESLAVSVAIIFGVIAVLFRSARILVASMFANALPLATILAVVWLSGDPLNLVTAFVFLVALGVIVDDTIHILYRDRHGENISGSSIEYSVVLSTMMLCLGLLLCQFSDFPTTRQFALYCTLALGGAVISDLTVLPALLRYRDSKQ